LGQRPALPPRQGSAARRGGLHQGRPSAVMQ
jgi:hypothetical protein